MMNKSLICPKSILVVGGSNNTAKPGGRLVKNLKDGNFSGDLLIINPTSDEVQGIKAYKSINDLPGAVDVAVFAIPAKFCLSTVEELLRHNKAQNFIILSAGFSEINKEGRIWEEQIVQKIEKKGGTLIGPNCIGVMNINYQAVFTSPIPKLVTDGCDLISGSGATAVFIMDAGTKNGLKFSSVYSIGNAAQTCVEDVLASLDEDFDNEKSAKIKLLYFETIKKPQLLLKHARSLIVNKGCKIVAIKAGTSTAGARAASSHTGALSNPQKAVECLFSKAGIISCNGREEMVSIAKTLMSNELKGKNIAIITNSGGPAVMLTDVLTKNGLRVLQLKSDIVDNLLEKLHPGSSATNPIDMLATGTADQLSFTIDTCENQIDNIDGMCIIFGNPGLFPIKEVFDVINHKIKICKKPIYVVLPSVLSAKKEIQDFIDEGNVVFDDEVVMGKAICNMANVSPTPTEENPFSVDKKKAMNIAGKKRNAYLAQDKVYELLDLAGIDCVNQTMTDSVDKAVEAAKMLGFPVVMKAVGILHKTEKKAVSLNVTNEEKVKSEFNRLIGIEGSKAVEISAMLKGLEIFIGVKREENFGHLVMCGMGGIYVEVISDVQATLVPTGMKEAVEMVRKLKIYKLIRGFRGRKGINERRIAETICKVSRLVEALPDIQEMDINPLIGSGDEFTAVDARIKI